MRISGGEWCGRKIRVPAGDKVRPTQDRVRGALFSMMMAEIPGARVLDLYAGSGSFGLDALSRGAAAATWVEADRHVFSVLKDNVRDLAARVAAETVQADALKWVTGPGAGRGYDLVFADPPYAQVEEQGFAPLMRALAAGGCLKPGGLFVGEMGCGSEPPVCVGWQLLRDRSYGQTRVALWRLEDAETGEETDGKRNEI